MGGHRNRIMQTLEIICNVNLQPERQCVIGKNQRNNHGTWVLGSLP